MTGAPPFLEEASWRLGKRRKIKTVLLVGDDTLLAPTQFAKRTLQKDSCCMFALAFCSVALIVAISLTGVFMTYLTSNVFLAQGFMTNMMACVEWNVKSQLEHIVVHLHTGHDGTVFELVKGSCEKGRRVVATLFQRVKAFCSYMVWQCTFDQQDTLGNQHTRKIHPPTSPVIPPAFQFPFPSPFRLSLFLLRRAHAHALEVRSLLWIRKLSLKKCASCSLLS